VAERREKGTGSVFQSKDGKWQGRIEISARDETGHKKTRCFSGKTEAEVKKQMKVWKNEHKIFSNESIRVMLFSTYITNWLELYKSPSLKPTSYKRLKCSVDHHVIPNIGHIPVGQLSTDRIQKLITDLSNSKNPQHSFSSIKKVHDAINSCLNDGVDKMDISFNACTAVKLPSIDKRKPVREIKVFSKDEKKAIISECQRKYLNGKPVYPYGVIFILMLNTGLRRGEAAALSWANVDLEKKNIHIDSNLIWLKDENGKSFLSVQKSTKTSSGVRDISLNKKAMMALITLKENGSKEFVLETPDGNHVSLEHLERSFYRVLENCSIPKSGLHALRHTFASDLYANGVDLKTISSLLGHASITITANTYVTVFKDAKQISVGLLDEDEAE